jgi:hypothetical protein
VRKEEKKREEFVSDTPSINTATRLSTLKEMPRPFPSHRESYRLNAGKHDMCRWKTVTPPIHRRLRCMCQLSLNYILYLLK